jgi:hypothetical protein
MFSYDEWEETANVQSQNKRKQLMFSHMGGNSSRNSNVHLQNKRKQLMFSHMGGNSSRNYNVQSRGMGGNS